MNKKGFTLIELLVCIAVIAILSVIVIAAMDRFNEKSRVGAVVDQIREMRTATALYITDTMQFPPTCDNTCTASTDPYIVAPTGVVNWSGPYFKTPIWSFEHPWGGHFGIESPGTDDNADGVSDMYLVLDNDAPGTGPSNDTAIITESALLRIDATIDDGNLATGDVRGNGQGFNSEVGELVILFRPI